MTEIKPEEIFTYGAPGRPLDPDVASIEKEYSLLRSFLVSSIEKNHSESEIEAAIEKKFKTVFDDVSHNCGSHLLKLVNPKCSGNVVLKVDDNKYFTSTNAAYNRYAQTIHRTIEIKNGTSKSLVEHIRFGDDHSEIVIQAFSNVFGDSILKIVMDNILGEAKVNNIHFDNFPIVFLPYKNSDIQATPVSKAEAFLNIKRLHNSLFVEDPDTKKKKLKGRFLKQEIADKMQNVSGATLGRRYRLLANIRKLSGTSYAQLYRYANGGRAPQMYSDFVNRVFVDYAKLVSSLNDRDHYSNKDMRDAAKSMAELIIASVSEFIDTINEQAHQIILEKEQKSESSAEPNFAGEKIQLQTPTIKKVLRLMKWPKEDLDLVLSAIDGDHFNEMIAKFGGK